MKKQLLLSFLLVSFFGCTYAEHPWADVYKKVFSKTDQRRNRTKHAVVFSKTNTVPFSQLLFSWNAFRPEQGHYQFSAQVRDATTKKWYPWHTMIDWGSAIQRSYLHKTSSGSGYYHVRLEVPHGRSADGFRIKVLPKGGASLSGLAALAASVSHNARYKPELIDWQLLKLASVYVRGVPMQSQRVLEHPRSQALCSPTSMSMLLGYLLKQKVDPVLFAQKAYDKGLDAYGSWPFNTAHAFEISQGRAHFHVARLNSFLDLYRQLQKGIPVVVSIRGTIPGGQKAYKSGYLVLVVGWDRANRQVVCHDPAFYTDRETVVRYNIKDFLTAWEKSRRLAYVAQRV